MTYQNYSLKQLQAIDAAHHLHPFTDHKELRGAGTRMIVRADGPFIYDSEGNEILDGMAGLWCVGVGYGRKELAEVAYDQMLELPYYNSFFKCSTPTPVLLAQKLAEIAPKSVNQVFFGSSGLGIQRHRAPAGAPLLGARRQAGEEPHHLAPRRLSRLDGRRRLARRHEAHARPARRAGAQHRPRHAALCLRDSPSRARATTLSACARQEPSRTRSSKPDQTMSRPSSASRSWGQGA